MWEVDEGQEPVSTVLHPGPTGSVLVVGSHYLSPLPTHPQQMLDKLWQRNLRPFIYKVRSTGPGGPPPPFLLSQ